jgi:hypothetical protein
MAMESILLGPSVFMDVPFPHVIQGIAVIP